MEKVKLSKLIGKIITGNWYYFGIFICVLFWVSIVSMVMVLLNIMSEGLPHTEIAWFALIPK